MILWYLIPAGICAIIIGGFIFFEWKSKGYCEGDDLGFFLSSFLPVINIVMLLILFYSFWNTVFSRKNRYFERKSK